MVSTRQGHAWARPPEGQCGDPQAPRPALHANPHLLFPVNKPALEVKQIVLLIEDELSLSEVYL